MVNQEFNEIPWSQQRRLRLIDFRLQWEGSFNRQDLKDVFDISTPQASLDIARYMSSTGARIRYDRGSRAYQPAVDFAPAFRSSGPQQYLTQLFATARGIVPAAESPLKFHPTVDTMQLPTRVADAHTLRAVVEAIREKASLEINYQSITRDERSHRVITPHAFGYDGFRWHARAYCHFRKGFRDFVLGRIVKVIAPSPLMANADEDDEWHRDLHLVLAPHPDLPASQRKGVELDYDMTGGKSGFTCRQAMFYYVLRALGFDHHGQPLPGVKQLCIENLSDIKPYLPKPGQK
jgi:hypothetical protein